MVGWNPPCLQPPDPNQQLRPETKGSGEGERSGHKTQGAGAEAENAGEGSET